MGVKQRERERERELVERDDWFFFSLSEVYFLGLIGFGGIVATEFFLSYLLQSVCNF